MKKDLFYCVVSIFLLLVACEPPQTKNDASSEHQVELTIHDVQQRDLEVIEFDGCEYVVFKDRQASNQGFGFMAHKGDCKNPIHCHNVKKDTVMINESSISNELEE